MGVEELLDAANKEEWEYVYENAAKADEVVLKQAGFSWLFSKDHNVRYLALTVLELSGYPAKEGEVVAAIVGRLLKEDDYMYVKYRAAFCLLSNGIGAYAREVSKVLVEARDSEDPVISATARKYIRKLAARKDNSTSI